MSHVNYTPTTLDVTSEGVTIDSLTTTIYTWCVLAPASSDFLDSDGKEIAFILKGKDRQVNILATNWTDEEGLELVRYCSSLGQRSNPRPCCLLS